MDGLRITRAAPSLCLALLPLAAALVASGCARPVSPPAKQDFRKEPTLGEARHYIQVFLMGCGMKDPGSAQVRSIRVAGRANWNLGRLHGGDTVGWLIQFEVSATSSYTELGLVPCEILVDNDGQVHWHPWKF